MNAPGHQTPHASPGVRRYAREHGATLTDIEGSGPYQRILKSDVIAYIRRQMQALSGEGDSARRPSTPSGQTPTSRQDTTDHRASTGVAGIPALPDIDYSRFGEIEMIERDPARVSRGRRLLRSWLNLPMVTHHEWADVGEIDAYRQHTVSDRSTAGQTLPIEVFHLKALAVTLRRFPEFNASLASDGKRLVLKRYLHLGITVDGERGARTVLIRDVDRKGLRELAEECQAADGATTPDASSDEAIDAASMTLTCLSESDGTLFTPIVDAPQVAILGITRARPMPVWTGDAFESRQLCPLSLSYDHRVIDGADAARFLTAYVATIGDSRRLLS